MSNVNVLLSCVALGALFLTGCSDNNKAKTPMNSLPTATAASFTTEADIPLTGQLAGMDADYDSLTFAVLTQPSNGTLALTATGSFTYTPNATVTGMDEFSFTVSDGSGTSAGAAVMITIDLQEVAFSDYSRAAFAQSPTDEPLAIKGRLIEQDVVAEDAYDDLLSGN